MSVRDSVVKEAMRVTDTAAVEGTRIILLPNMSEVISVPT